MTSKQKIENSNRIVMLTVSHEEFKQRLSDRIEIGEKLLSSKVENNADFSELEGDYKNWNDYNIEFLKQIFTTPQNDYLDSYNQAGYTFLGQMGEVRNNPVQSKKNLLDYKLKDLKSLLTKADLIRTELVINTIFPNSSRSAKSYSEVFIVHGHDDLAKTKAARFVEKLGLKPIILHEQTSSGKTIIEKIEEYTNVGFGIVLYTPCDSGCKKGEEKNFKNRARQNVVFEHGYLIGKIGRQNVCALVKGDIEVPNDISGVVYVNMDDDDSWHLKIAKELRSSGYDIDMNKL